MLRKVIHGDQKKLSLVLVGAERFVCILIRSTIWEVLVRKTETLHEGQLVDEEELKKLSTVNITSFSGF